MVHPPFHLTAVSGPKGLEQIRHLVRKSAGMVRLTENETASLILAVDEVCSNIIRHGYKKDLERKIDLSILIGTNSFQIEIIDDGLSFDLTSAQPKDPMDLKPGGLGIYIIKQVMDKIKYSTDDAGRNKTTLIKKL